jgi:hypothetical protein
MAADTMPSLPDLHAQMPDRVVAAVRCDDRFEALLGTGSLAYGGFDEHSDLDFVIVVRAADHAAAMAGRQAFAAGLGSLLAFGGEHVGEPRLLICLFGPPLLHVDLKFIVPGDLSALSERPMVLWARNSDDLERRLAWVWLHYVATKLLRGEHFEAIGGLDFFRDQVLGAMLQRNAGRRPRGVRRVEDVEGAKGLLAPTLPSTGHRSIAEALKRSAALYVELRTAEPPSSPVKGMPGLLLDFIDGKQSRA